MKIHDLNSLTPDNDWELQLVPFDARWMAVFVRYRIDHGVQSDIRYETVASTPIEAIEQGMVLFKQGT
jgi:hypothetical protein